MADDKTMIMNVALSAVGEAILGSIDDESPNATKCKAMIETVINELLAEDWFFNRKRAKLDNDADFPDDVTGYSDFTSWDYRHTIPPDCLYIRYLVDESYDQVHYPYVREGQYILSNCEEAYLLYNSTLNDASGEANVSLMPRWFHRLISARLAFIMAPNIAQNTWIKQKVEIEYKEAYLYAREKNGEEAYNANEQGNDNWAEGARRALS